MLRVLRQSKVRKFFYILLFLSGAAFAAPGTVTTSDGTFSVTSNSCNDVLFGLIQFIGNTNLVSYNCSSNPVISNTVLVLHNSRNSQNYQYYVSAITSTPAGDSSDSNAVSSFDLDYAWSAFNFFFGAVLYMFFVGLSVGAIYSLILSL